MTVRRLLVVFAALAGALGGAQAQPTEEAVKAAFLPRFARYVDWPPASQPATGADFQLCVIGHDPFRRLLDQSAAAESIDGRRVQVRRMASAANAAGCHLAYVRGGAPADTGRLLMALRGHPVLTVTDASAGTQRGMIHFANLGGRVRFFIDEAQAAERGLSISSRLLALAVSVRQRR